jgi:arylformamidase
VRREFLKKVLGLLAMGLPTGGQFAVAGPEEDESSVADNEPTESGPFELPVGARLERDLTYGKDPRQRLDVYHPAAAAHSPLIFMVHGGAWMRGSKSLWRVVKNKVTHWVSKGYIFVSIDYRMAPESDPLAQVDEVATALAFVQSRLRAWGGDPSRLIVMGHSSGAHLVALLTADPAISARRGAVPWLATISLDSAAMDVEQLMQRRHPGFYDRVFKRDPAFWREASPTLRLHGKPVAPTLIVCSARRRDSCSAAQAFAAKASKLGGRVEVLSEDLSHPEINDQLGSASAYTERVDTFLKSVGLP